MGAGRTDTCTTETRPKEKFPKTRKQLQWSTRSTSTSQDLPIGGMTVQISGVMEESGCRSMGIPPANLNCPRSFLSQVQAAIMDQEVHDLLIYKVIEFTVVTLSQTKRSEKLNT